jgi:hypothetical protein
VVARNANEAVVTPMEGSAFGGTLESGERFWVVRLAGTGFSRREDVFTFDLLYKEILYIYIFFFFTFNAICKDNAAIKCITEDGCLLGCCAV